MPRSESVKVELVTPEQLATIQTAPADSTDNPPSDQRDQPALVAEETVQRRGTGEDTQAEARLRPDPQPFAPPAERPLTSPQPTPPVPAALPPSDALMPATRLYAAKILSDPRSRKARLALRELATSERQIQLCNIEAMEQVHRWRPALQPDFLIAYATADTRLSGETVEAEGAALRSRKHWFGMRYRCEVNADLSGVVAFSFAVGAEIPKDRWDDAGLTADDGPDDDDEG